MINIDELIDEATLSAELEDGRPLATLSTRYGLDLSALPFLTDSESGSRNYWTDEDMAYLCTHAGILSDEEIGNYLGRTAGAIRTQRVRRGFSAPTRCRSYYTAHQVAKMLGADVHTICKWIGLGLLRAELNPLTEREIWRIYEPTLFAFILNPLNWPYLMPTVTNPHRITNSHLRHLLQRQIARWPDRWLRPSEVAALHTAANDPAIPIDHTDVNRLIHQGKIESVKWGNHWVRYSEATKPGLMFYKGKGANRFVNWTPRGNAFVVLARAVGLAWSHISRMMGEFRPDGRPMKNKSTYRYDALHQMGLIPHLARQFDLKLRYDHTTGACLADWRDYTNVFPSLAEAATHAAEQRPLTPYQAQLIRGLLWCHANYHWRVSGLSVMGEFVHALQYNGGGLDKRVVDIWEQMKRQGIDPITGETAV